MAAEITSEKWTYFVRRLRLKIWFLTGNGENFILLENIQHP
jgi:hypothetical protein